MTETIKILLVEDEQIDQMAFTRFGRVLVMVGLAEGIAIYGLIVSILILNRLG